MLTRERMSDLAVLAVAGHARSPRHVCTVRPLQPPLQRTLALIQHRNKPDEPALAIVRNALQMLRAGGEVEPAAVTHPSGKRNRRAQRNKR